MFTLIAFAAITSADLGFFRSSLSGPTPLAVLILQNFFSRNVTVERADYLGRPALKVAFTKAYELNVVNNGLLLGNAYVTVPLSNFYDGTIDVDIAAERNIGADESVRAFTGVAFRTKPSLNDDTYDLIYLRMTNGLLDNPPPTGDRAVRAVQYVSLPKWDFNVLREKFPGKYEAGAKIAEKRWNHLQIQVKNNTAQVFIDWDPKPVLQFELLEANQRGPIRLWVGQSTTAYFSNLQIRCHS